MSSAFFDFWFLMTSISGESIPCSPKGVGFPGNWKNQKSEIKKSRRRYWHRQLHILQYYPTGTIFRIPFQLINPKTFLKSENKPLKPFYNNFEARNEIRRPAPAKMKFFGQNLAKSAQNISKGRQKKLTQKLKTTVVITRSVFCILGV